MQTQQAAVTDQQKQLGARAAQLNAQTAQIERVNETVAALEKQNREQQSAILRMSKEAPAQ